MVNTKHYIASLVILLSFLSISNLHAQDIHYTQFTLQGLQQSPAFAGNFDGNHRFATLYRNQWATVSVPYNTLGFSYDVNIVESKKFQSYFAAGGQSFFDQAGDGRLRTFYVQLPLSYSLFVPINEKLNMKLGAGLGLALVNKSLNTSQLQFDNQYTGDFFDPSIPIAENFDNLQFTRPDLSIGSQIGLIIKGKTSLGVAFGLHHLNNIQESFIDDGRSIQLARRLALPAYIQFPLTPQWELRFDYLHQVQRTLSEHTFGALAKYYLKNDGPAQTSISFGSYYRWKDAISGIVRYQKNNWLFAFSYDSNVSPLRAATNSYGGIEIGAVYIIKKVEEPKIKYKRKCIVF
jgi:type IX secretion system PorP/SprF family membrane protein